MTSVVGKASGWVAAGHRLYPFHQKNSSYPFPPPGTPITHTASVVYKTTHLENTKAQLTWLLWHVFLLHTVTHTGISFTSLQPLNDGFQTAWLFDISEWWHIGGILFWSWDQTHPFVVIEKYWWCLLGAIKTALSWQNRNLSFVRPLGASQGLGWLQAALKSHLPRAILVLLAGQAHMLRTWFPGRQEAAVVSLQLSQLCQKKPLKTTQAPE